MQVEEEEVWRRVLDLVRKGTGIGEEVGEEGDTIISTITFFKPCGVGILPQTLSTVISHTRKRGCDLDWDWTGGEFFGWRKDETNDPSDGMHIHDPKLQTPNLLNWPFLSVPSGKESSGD